LGFEVTRDGEKNAVAVDDGAVRRDEQRAICVAVKGNAKCGALGAYALLQFFEMERAAFGVDIAAVRFGADADDVATERRKKFGAELVGGAIGAVENDAETLERSSGDHATAEKIQILMMERKRPGGGPAERMKFVPFDASGFPPRFLLQPSLETSCLRERKA